MIAPGHTPAWAAWRRAVRTRDERAIIAAVDAIDAERAASTAAVEAHRRLLRALAEVAGAGGS